MSKHLQRLFDPDPPMALRLAAAVCVAEPAAPGNRTLHLPWATLVKLFAAVVAGWAIVRLWPSVQLFLISVLLAVALSPIVDGLERRGSRADEPCLSWRSPSSCPRGVLLLRPSAAHRTGLRSLEEPAPFQERAREAAGRRGPRPRASSFRSWICRVPRIRRPAREAPDLGPEGSRGGGGTPDRGGPQSLSPLRRQEGRGLAPRLRATRAPAAHGRHGPGGLRGRAGVHDRPDDHFGALFGLHVRRPDGPQRPRRASARALRRPLRRDSGGGNLGGDGGGIALRADGEPLGRADRLRPLRLLPPLRGVHPRPAALWKPPEALDADGAPRDPGGRNARRRDRSRPRAADRRGLSRLREALARRLPAPRRAWRTTGPSATPTERRARPSWTRSCRGAAPGKWSERRG